MAAGLRVTVRLAPASTEVLAGTCFVDPVSHFLEEYTMLSSSWNSFKAGAALALSIALAGTFAPSATADTIDAALRDEAPRIMKYIHSHGYHTVGVLKFAVKKGTRAESLDSGTLNAKMAARLEHALILLNDPSAPIDVLHDVGRAATAQSRGATFRNAQGRRGLFEHDYSVAWGSEKKKPDMFLTGEVLVNKDMKTLSIVVQAFSSRKPEAIEEVVRIKNVPTDRDVLASIGQSFVLSRRLGHKSARELDEAAANDASKRDNTSANPLKDSDDPVQLEIFYDGAPVALEADTSSPGEVRVRTQKAADPKEGQKVKFVVTNKSSDTVGVVLAVNGKSTLFLEDLTSQSPGECTKWVLAPGEAYTIEGFYMSEDGKQVRAFKVLSDDESAKADLSPDQKGVFTLFAFRPIAGGTATALNVSSEGGDLSRSPAGHPGKRSLPELQAALQATNHTHASNGRLVAEHVTHHPGTTRSVRQKGGRGLVVEDSQSSTGSNLNRVDKPFDPKPSMSLCIRYYAGAGLASQ